MSITPKVGGKVKPVLRAPVYFARYNSLSRRVFVRGVREICSRSQTLRVYTRETRDKWRDEFGLTQVLEVNGNRRGDRIFNMLSSCILDMSAFSLLQPPLSSPLLPFPTKPSRSRILIIIRTG